MIKIWVDDERPMPEGYNIWCKTVYEAIAKIGWCFGGGEDVLVSLDHDSSDRYSTEDGDYINILKAYSDEWARNFFLVLDRKLKVHFHSANPVGVKNMRAIVEKCPWMEEV